MQESKHTLILFFPVLPHKDKMNRVHSTPKKPSKQVSRQASKQTNNKNQILYEAPELIFLPPPHPYKLSSHCTITTNLNSMSYKAMIATKRKKAQSLLAAFVSKMLRQENQEFRLNLDYSLKQSNSRAVGQSPHPI